jgi:hypothetical protein
MQYEAGGAGSEQLCRVMHVIGLLLLLHDATSAVADVAPLMLLAVALLWGLGLPAVYA